MHVIKLPEGWYLPQELKDFIALLEKQQTADRDNPGEYILHGAYKYKINNNYDIIMEGF